MLFTYSKLIVKVQLPMRFTIRNKADLMQEQLTCNICGKPLKKRTVKVFGGEQELFECPRCDSRQM